MCIPRSCNWRILDPVPKSQTRNVPSRELVTTRPAIWRERHASHRCRMSVDSVELFAGFNVTDTAAPSLETEITLWPSGDTATFPCSSSRRKSRQISCPVCASQICTSFPDEAIRRLFVRENDVMGIDVIAHLVNFLARLCVPEIDRSALRMRNDPPPAWRECQATDIDQMRNAGQSTQVPRR